MYNGPVRGENVALYTLYRPQCSPPTSRRSPLARPTYTTVHHIVGPTLIHIQADLHTDTYNVHPLRQIPFYFLQPSHQRRHPLRPGVLRCPQWHPLPSPANTRRLSRAVLQRSGLETRDSAQVRLLSRLHGDSRDWSIAKDGHGQPTAKRR